MARAAAGLLEIKQAAELRRIGLGDGLENVGGYPDGTGGILGRYVFGQAKRVRGPNPHIGSKWAHTNTPSSLTLWYNGQTWASYSLMSTGLAWIGLPQFRTVG